MNIGKLTAFQSLKGIIPSRIPAHGFTCHCPIPDIIIQS